MLCTLFQTVEIPDSQSRNQEFNIDILSLPMGRFVLFTVGGMSTGQAARVEKE